MKLYKDPRDFRPPKFQRDRVQFDGQQRRQNYNNQPRDADVHRTDRKLPEKRIRRKVKKMLKSKYMKNKRYYLVKWKDDLPYCIKVNIQCLMLYTSLKILISI